MVLIHEKKRLWFVAECRWQVFCLLFPKLERQLILITHKWPSAGLQGRKVHQCRISNVAMATLALTMGSERLQQVLIREGGGG